MYLNKYIHINLIMNKKKIPKKQSNFFLIVISLLPIIISYKYFKDNCIGNPIFTAGDARCQKNDIHQLQPFEDFLLKTDCTLKENEQRFKLFAEQLWELIYILATKNDKEINYVEIQDIFVQMSKQGDSLICLYDNTSLKTEKDITSNNVYGIFILIMNSLLSFVQDKCQDDIIYILLMDSINKATMYEDYKLVLNGTKEGDEYHNELVNTYQIPIPLRFRVTFSMYLWNSEKPENQIILSIVKKIKDIVNEVNKPIDVLLCNIILLKDNEILITKYQIITSNTFEEKKEMVAFSNKLLSNKINYILNDVKDKSRKIMFNPFSTKQKENFLQSFYDWSQIID